MAGLYLVELMIHVFYSPDVDVINGLKMAVQVALQTIVILTAALVTSGRVKSNYGEQLCVQVSLVQIFLAIPEQIWGVVSITVLRKGPPREPDFKTTAEELAVARERGAVSFMQKIKAGGTILKSIKSMAPVLKQGDPVAIIVEIVVHKQLLDSLEMLENSHLCILFEDIFHCQRVRNALEREAKSQPELSSSIQALLANKWHTSVDLRNGMFHLYSIQELLEGKNAGRVQLPGEQLVAVHGKDFGWELSTGQYCPMESMNVSHPFYPFPYLDELKADSMNVPSVQTRTPAFELANYPALSLSQDLVFSSFPKPVEMESAVVMVDDLKPETLCSSESILDVSDRKSYLKSKDNGQGLIVTKSHIEDEISYKKDQNEDAEQGFRQLIKRVFGAMDGDTVDVILEKLMNALPEALTSLLDEVPEGLASVAAIASLEMEGDDEEEEVEHEEKQAVIDGHPISYNKNSPRLLESHIKNENMDGADGNLNQAGDNESAISAESRDFSMGLTKNPVSSTSVTGTFFIGGSAFGQASSESANTLSAMTAFAPEHTQNSTKNAKERQFTAPVKAVVPAVRLICGLSWDWFLFWMSFALALAALFVLTALANTNCSCTAPVSG